MHHSSAPKSHSLSAIIITKNEAHNLPECLASIQFCGEVLILDNGSSDGTVAIARSLGARVVETEMWLGYGPQKQAALELASGKWVLSIDADERVSKELALEICRAVESGQSFGYSILRENYFLGKRMRFGGWGRDRIVRLARANHCHFTSEVVHESLVCKDPIEQLDGSLLHFSYRSIDDVFEKQIRYAKLGAIKLVGSNSRTNHPHLRAMWTFVRLYFLQLGFLDGWRGTLSAVTKSYGTFWRYALANQRHH